MTRVLRCRKGETISVVDGCGLRYRVMIEQIGRNSVEGKILNQVRRENEPVANLTLAGSIPAGTKMDWVIEKCTEVGVRSFIPVLSEHTLVEFGDRAKVKRKLARWNKIAIAAMKQSLRCFLPKIEEPLELANLVQKTGDYDMSLVANLKPESKSLKEIFQSETLPRDILLLVGPEAGFTEEELDLCLGRGFIPVKLGPRRLRAETACLTFCALVLSHLGDLE